MKLITYDSKLIHFLSGNNTIITKNKNEYETFCKTMNIVGLSTERLDKIAQQRNYKMVIEYVNGKGFSFWNQTEDLEKAIKESTQWYYEQPFNIEEIKLI